MDTALLETLLRAYGPSGNEEPVREAIERALAGRVDEMDADAMGNLVAVRRGDGTGRRVMLCAHMDHIGLVVLDADEQGFLRVSPVGGIDAGNMDSMHVIFGNGVGGVVSREETDEKSPRVRDLFVDIGAESREEALSRVAVGDMCVMQPRVSRLGEHRVASRAMDDRVACFALCEAVRALPEKLKDDVYAVFTVQEEVGVRGATVAAFKIRPDLGVAVDVTCAGDTPGEKDHLPMKLGKGAAVKVMDMNTIASPAVVKLMEERAKEYNIPVQREVLPFGGTDAGAIQQSRAGCPVGAISIPCRYVHSAAETVDLRDVEAAVKLLVAIVD